jgi:catechol 2,3-dioxygenase-like lactoylglutathione lyase family enzyme
VTQHTGTRTDLGVTSIDAITLATHDIARSLAFYRLLGGELEHGSDDTTFATFKIGGTHLNLVLEPREIQWSFWGRIVFHVDDVDAAYTELQKAGVLADGAPRDAEWGERYFHVTDPDGHQLSFAKPLNGRDRRAAAGGHHARPGTVTQAGEDSFPASDPPSHTATTGETKSS